MFKNVDTSGLTPEQLADAELMQEYAASPACRSNFQTVQHAERLLGHLIESEHRLAPVDAFTLALKYAEHAHNAGEDYMQAAFETWKANRPAPVETDDDEAFAASLEAADDEAFAASLEAADDEAFAASLEAAADDEAFAASLEAADDEAFAASLEAAVAAALEAAVAAARPYEQHPPVKFPIDHTETITRDDAIADTERHVNEGGRDVEAERATV